MSAKLMVFSLSRVVNVIDPSPRYSYASRMAAAADTGSCPDRSSEPNATPGRIRPVYCWS
jgi:hypothetical protein